MQQINNGFFKNLPGVCVVGISVLGLLAMSAAGGGVSGGKTIHILDTVPQVYPTGFLVDTPTIVRIQEHLDGVTALDVNSVGLFRVDADLVPIGEALCFLRDDGSVDHGDASRGDGVFSCNVLFRESSPRRILLAVQAQAGGVTVSSPSFFLDAVTPLTDAEIGTLLAGQEAAGRIWEQELARLGDTREARVETVAGIRLLEGVADAGIDRDGTNIWIAYRSGIGGGLYLASLDLGGAELPPSVSIAALPTEEATLTSIPPTLRGQSSDIAAASPGVYVGNNKVLIWNALEAPGELDLRGVFEESKCPAFHVTVLRGEECTGGRKKASRDHLLDRGRRRGEQLVEQSKGVCELVSEHVHEIQC